MIDSTKATENNESEKIRADSEKIRRMVENERYSKPKPWKKRKTIS